MPPAPAPSSATDLLAALRFRGLVHQCTDEKGLAAHLGSADLASGGRRAYCGFDPTADSLTIGNLVPMTMLRHWQQAGHTPVVVVGGGTGLIGDPSGKSAERQLLTEERVRANVEAQKKIFERYLDFDPGRPNRAHIVNNADWLKPLGFLEALRDIGKHFSINEMIKRDSVRERLENREQGISYTEFSYMLLQAYDFLHLFRDMGVTVQLAGSDQWGNIVPGVDLIRRAAASPPPPRGEGRGEGLGDSSHQTAHNAFGLTAPLVTKADGGKFGKTESGAIWLSPERTSPYAFFQFWLNASDADVKKFLRFFSFIPDSEVLTLEAAHDADPAKREAHRALARHMTALLHGEIAMKHAESAAQALFSGDVAHLDLATLNEVFASVPATQHARTELAAGIPLADLLPQTSLCKSKREAREHLSAGAVTLNGKPVGPDARLTNADLLHGQIALLRRGKKAWHVTRWA